MEEAIEATRNAKEIKEAAHQSVIDANEQVQNEIINIQEAMVTSFGKKIPR